MSIESIDCERVIRRLAARGADFADLYYVEREGVTITLEDGAVDRVRKGIDRGIGVRLIRSLRTLYAYASEVTPATVDELVDTLLSAGDLSPGSGDLTLTPASPSWLSRVDIDPQGIELERKTALLTEADAAARAHGDEIVQVKATYGDERKRIIQVTSDGLWVDFERTGLIFAVHVTAKREQLLQTGYESTGAQRGMELLDEDAPSAIGSRAAARAMLMLSAREAPTGTMPVVLDSSAGGTMIHEAVGHGLEGDFIHEGMSVYAGRVGEYVASEVVSVADDPTLPGKRGSYPFDDEGTRSRCNTLIDRGVLKGFLHDRLSAMKMGEEPTGNGRRESYRFKPVPRMSNTFILPGETNPQDILRATPNGLLVRKMGGGQVNPVNGDFVFEVAEGYLIQNGRQGDAVRGATLAGNGPQVLQHIDMVGSDLGFAIGTCGKDGQGVPVADAQPTLRIGTPDNPETWITVGGTASTG